MQLKMMNVLNKILYEKKRILNDEEILNDVCENCGECHSDLDECVTNEQEDFLDEQSSTSGMAGMNLPLGDYR